MLQLLQSYAPVVIELCSSRYRAMLHMIQSMSLVRSHNNHTLSRSRNMNPPLIPHEEREGDFSIGLQSQKRSLRDSYRSSSIASISSIWSIIS